MLLTAEYVGWFLGRLILPPSADINKNLPDKVDLSRCDVRTEHYTYFLAEFFWCGSQRSSLTFAPILIESLSFPSFGVFACFPVRVSRMLEISKYSVSCCRPMKNCIQEKEFRLNLFRIISQFVLTNWVLMKMNLGFKWSSTRCVPQFECDPHICQTKLATKILKMSENSKIHFAIVENINIRVFKSSKSPQRPLPLIISCYNKYLISKWGLIQIVLRYQYSIMTSLGPSRVVLIRESKMYTVI